MDFPLNEMKILDFTTLLPGPYGTMILADHGADIIKIENFNNPDLLRFMPPIVDGISVGFSQINRGKRSLGLNLKLNNAKEIVYKLVEEYDIVIEQFRPGVMDKLGIGYEKLKEINPSIIYCSLTGYGQSGSYRDRAGHDINYLALSGIPSFSGRKETGPSLNGIQIADIAGGGMHMAMSVLIAYIKRLRTGEGDYIDVSMTDCVFSLTTFHASSYLAGGKMPEIESDALNGGTIYDYYRTSDNRFLSVGPVEQKFFKNFCNTLGLDPPNDGIMMPDAGVDDLKKKAAEIISSKTMEEWADIFKKTDACVEPVHNFEEVISKPPLSERDMVFTITNHNGTALKQISNPLKYKSGVYNSEFSGVSVGCHNEKILNSLGFSDNDIKRLIDDKIINE